METRATWEARETRTITSKTYSCIRTGDNQNQNHLVEPKPVYTGGQAAVYQAKYIESQDGGLKETNDIIKIQPLNLKKLNKEINLLKRFGLKVSFLHDETHSYIVMENYGPNLLQFLKNNLIPISERVQIVLALLNEVQLLEQEGIFHRDLKLENICIDKKMDEASGKYFYDVRIIDFGYATFVKPGKVKKGGEKGTFPYLSPDERLSFASDRYALAVIIAAILGCDFRKLLRERMRVYRAYEKLSEVEKAQYKISMLPGYDFNSLSVLFYPESGKLRNNLLHVLSTLTDPSPRMRYGIPYLIKFFLEIYKANKTYEEKNILDLAIETGVGVFEWFDDGLEKLDNYMAGTGSWENKSKKSQTGIKLSVDAVNVFYEKDYCEAAEQAMKGSPEYYLLNLARYRDKFKGTNSDGIIKIFDEMEAAGTFDDKIAKMAVEGRAKLTPPLMTFGCFARKPRHLNIDIVYGKVAQLQRGSFGNFAVLDDIENDFKTLTFV